MKQKKNEVIIIFPYLFIEEINGLQLDGLRIKPAYKENIDSEKKYIKNHLFNLAKLFKYGNNYQISYFSYAIFSYQGRNWFEKLKEKLNKFTTILRFSQVSDLRGTASFDHFNYFLFDLNRYNEININVDVKRKIYGYEGILNGESSFLFSVENDSAQKPYISYNIWNPNKISASYLSKNDYYMKLYSVPDLIFKENELKKILRAIEWFNRSFSHYGRGVDISEAIVNIHIALEALLRPTDEDRGIKAQIKTAMFNLLGHLEELNTWFNTFWQLRNSIVHGDIKPESFIYIHPKSTTKKGHRHQLYLARKVFIGCLNAILKLRPESTLIGFDEELMSNEVRVNDAIKTFKKHKGNLKEIENHNTFKNISSLKHDDLSATKEKTKELGRLLLPIIKADLKNIKSQYSDARQHMENVIVKILTSKINNNELSILYSDLEHNYSFAHAKWNNFNSELSSLRYAAYQFFNFASWRLFVFYD